MRINVIDLDLTLVPFDTFRHLIVQEIKKGNIKLLLFSLKRKLRFISSSEFKENVQLNLMRKYDESFFKNFADQIFCEIDLGVMEIIQQESDEKTINILISASPDSYVQPLIKKLNWRGKGSYFDDNQNFIHLFKENKIHWLQTNFCPREYLYHFAISDSSSDLELLSLFKTSRIWRPF